MSATRKSEFKPTAMDHFKLWTAALFSGLLTFSGCGGDATTTETSSETPTTTQSESPGGSQQTMADSMSSENPNHLLQSAPDKWLQHQVQTATELRKEGKYAEEVDAWEATIASLNNQVGAGYWVTAGARLSQEVAKQLAKMDANQLAKWEKFQQLELEVAQQRADLEMQRGKGEISEAQFKSQLDSLVAKCDQQRAIVEQLFGHQNHLLGNVAFARAELLGLQHKYIPALVEAERSLRLRESSIKVQHPDTLESLRLMGKLSKEIGRLDLARDCYKRAVRQAEHVWGTQHLSYAEHANDLGVFIYWALENKKEIAESYSDAGHWIGVAMRVRQNRLGDDALLTAMSLRNLALLKMGEGASKNADYSALDYAAAENAMEQAIPVFRSKSTDQAMLAQVLIESATAKMLVKEFETAEARLREVRNGELAEFNPDAISLSLNELDYRIAAACLKQQDDAEKVATGKAMMDQLINHQSSDQKAIALAARATRMLEKLHESKKFTPLPAIEEPQTRISALPETSIFK